MTSTRVLRLERRLRGMPAVIAGVTAVLILGAAIATGVVMHRAWGGRHESHGLHPRDQWWILVTAIPWCGAAALAWWLTRVRPSLATLSRTCALLAVCSIGIGLDGLYPHGPWLALQLAVVYPMARWGIGLWTGRVASQDTGRSPKIVAVCALLGAFAFAVIGIWDLVAPATVTFRDDLTDY